MTQPGKIDCSGLTDKGRVRDRNEDQFLVGGLNKSMLIRETSLSIDDPARVFGGTQGHLLVVADGMGGHQSGEVASSTAVDSLTHYILNTMPWFFGLHDGQGGDQLNELKDALRSCQESLSKLMHSQPQREGMGTTLTMAYILWPRAYIVHAGDSRCYLLRGSKLEQITTDHTIAQSMVDKGALSKEEAEDSRWSHILWNAVGGKSEEVLPDGYRAELQIGDTLLLCTDGLTRHVDDPAITRILEANESAATACQRLVSEANDAGGEDNVTVVVARFMSMDAVTDDAAEAAAEHLLDDAHDTVATAGPESAPVG